ncbi:S24 family peptidase [Rhodopseudomonas palustris]|uniref:S24 family peptidase n=1 Tax=Rhodopseudomonas palustris TaxID=1076 RepID=UPI0016009E7E|nr:S24 family peptidase [Rhodopseudomonas palustris]
MEIDASMLKDSRVKSLNIKQIRSFVEQLEALPDGASLPDWSELSVGDRFAICLRLIPQRKREALLGKSEPQIRRYEAGLDIPLTVVAALAVETEIPLDWIASGRPMQRRLPASVAAVGSTDGEDLPVRKLAFKVDDSGALTLDDAAGQVQFPRAILQRVGVAPANARLLEAFGESMTPTLSDGDLLLIDVGATKIVEGKIFVFSVGADAFIKRLRRIGDRVLMISDNREMFPEQEVPSGAPFSIYGRVKWAGRSL